jgi:hypothetical protein
MTIRSYLQNFKADAVLEFQLAISHLNIRAFHALIGAITRNPDQSGQQGLFWRSIPRRFMFLLFYSTKVPCHLNVPVAGLQGSFLFACEKSAFLTLPEILCSFLRAAFGMM